MYFCSMQRPNMEICGRIFVGMEAGSSPLCLELCLCLLWLCQGGAMAVLSPPRAAVQFQGIPVTPLGCRGPFSPCQQHMAAAQQHPLLRVQMYRPETATNHLPAGTAKTWEARVSFLLPRSQGPALWSCAL